MSCAKLPWKKAMALVEMGIKEFSNMGRYCPILLRNNQQIDLTHFGDSPVCIGDHIYFVKGKQNVSEFEKKLATYTNQVEPKPALGSTCCIVGNPKAGKSSLALSLVERLDAVHLTVSKILQSILDGSESTSLYEQIRVGLSSGNPLPDQVVVDATLVMTSRLIANGKGWILDGFPMTTNQAILLDKANFQPHMFFELNASEETLMERSQKDLDEESVNHATPGLHLSEHTLSRNCEWLKEREQIQNLFDSKYSNWSIMDASRSRWDLKHEAVESCRSGLTRRQTYMELKSKGLAAPVSEIGLDNSYIMANRSHFEGYCPVSLVDGEFLFFSTSVNAYMAEYEGKYYFMKDQQSLASFLETPEKYVAAKLPNALPTKRPRSDVKTMFPKTLSFKGYCPVTFFEGPSGFESIVPGLHDFVVDYDNGIFAFRDEEQLQKFMSIPWKYAKQSLPIKLPPPNAPIPLAGLPVVGYLEQTIATSLTKGLLSVGKAKPKHPFKSIEASARLYLAYHLKGIEPLTQPTIPSRKIGSRRSMLRTFKSLRIIVT
jgi:adenylate kinase family enzyme/YHS domain-containing protein